MPALNYTVFVDKVESGEKKHTIRKERKVPIKVGDKLIMFTGQRTTACRELGRAICTKVDKISIFETDVKINGASLNWHYLAALSRNDGFDSIVTFKKFFKD